MTTTRPCSSLPLPVCLPPGHPGRHRTRAAGRTNEDATREESRLYRPHRQRQSSTAGAKLAWLTTAINGEPKRRQPCDANGPIAPSRGAWSRLGRCAAPRGTLPQRVPPPTIGAGVVRQRAGRSTEPPPAHTAPDRPGRAGQSSSASARPTCWRSRAAASAIRAFPVARAWRKRAYGWPCDVIERMFAQRARAG